MLYSVFYNPLGSYLMDLTQTLNFSDRLPAILCDLKDSPFQAPVD